MPRSRSAPKPAASAASARPRPAASPASPPPQQQQSTSWFGGSKPAPPPMQHQGMRGRMHVWCSSASVPHSCHHPTVVPVWCTSTPWHGMTARVVQQGFSCYLSCQSGEGQGSNCCTHESFLYLGMSIE